MGIFAALLPSILQSLPELLKVFGSDSDSEVRKRNQAAGVVVAETLIKATNAVNLQEAEEKLRTDPAALAAAREALSPVIAQLVETGGGGIDGARKAAASPDGDWRKLVFTFPFALAVAFLPLIYSVVLAALVKRPWLAEFSDDARMMVITAVINLILGALVGYVYGQSNQAVKRATDK
jgi:hypothetical protein